MIDWKLMREEKPPYPDAFYLIQESGGMVTSGYWSGSEWAVPWGREYPKDDQPKTWAEFNFPRIIE